MDNWRETLERKLKECEWEIERLERELRDLRLDVAQPELCDCVVGNEARWVWCNGGVYGYDQKCNLPPDVFEQLTDFLEVDHEDDAGLAPDVLRAYETEEEAIEALVRAIGYN